VKIGCLAQLVNVIAPIMTEPGGPAWRQASFHPFALTSRYGRGTVLRLEPDAPRHETKEHGEVPLLDAVAVRPDEGGLVLFAVNRSQTEPMSLDVDLRALTGVSTAEHTCLADEDPDAINSMDQPERVVPRRLDDPKLDGGRLQAGLPPLSWNMIRIS
jgi:alpha-N-arabinofuranosidase